MVLANFGAPLMVLANFGAPLMGLSFWILPATLRAILDRSAPPFVGFFATLPSGPVGAALSMGDFVSPSVGDLPMVIPPLGAFGAPPIVLTSSGGAA